MSAVHAENLLDSGGHVSERDVSLRARAVMVVMGPCSALGPPRLEGPILPLSLDPPSPSATGRREGLAPSLPPPSPPPMFGNRGHSC